MQNQSHCIIDPLTGTEALMTAFVGKDPDSSKDKALQNGVDKPETVSSERRCNSWVDERGHIGESSNHGKVDQDIVG